MTSSIFKTWKTSRKHYSNFLEQYSLEQLNKVPDQLNNNLIWNVGHILVAQDFLVYKASGLDVSVSETMIDLYKPGTKPTKNISQIEVDKLHTLLLSQIEQTENDYHAGLFKTYKERTTGTGFHLGTIEDALEFNNYHEGIHLGFMWNIKKFV